jgi:transposase
LEPGASVSAIARRSGINANMLFKWRREHVRAAGDAPPTVLLPIEVAPASEVRSIPTTPAEGGSAEDGEHPSNVTPIERARRKRQARQHTGVHDLPEHLPRRTVVHAPHSGCDGQGCAR